MTVVGDRYHGKIENPFRYIMTLRKRRFGLHWPAFSGPSSKSLCGNSTKGRMRFFATLDTAPRRLVDIDRRPRTKEFQEGPT